MEPHRGELQPLTLGEQHAQQLTASRDQGGQLLLQGVVERAQEAFQVLTAREHGGQLGEYECIDGVGLGQARLRFRQQVGEVRPGAIGLDGARLAAAASGTAAPRPRWPTRPDRTGRRIAPLHRAIGGRRGPRPDGLRGHGSVPGSSGTILGRRRVLPPTRPDPELQPEAFEDLQDLAERHGGLAVLQLGDETHPHTAQGRELRLGGALGLALGTDTTADLLSG
jgi:hypothetical protein